MDGTNNNFAINIAGTILLSLASRSCQYIQNLFETLNYKYWIKSYFLYGDFIKWI